MPRKLLAAVLALAGCSSMPGGPFAVQEKISNITAPPGANTEAVTMKGEVVANFAIYPRLTVAIVNETETLAASPVTNGRFELALPAKPDLHNEAGLAYIERWWLVLFNDHNGNGKFDVKLPPDKILEQDHDLPLLQSYRVGYRAYADGNTHHFLPLNSLKRGWVLAVRLGSKSTYYSQDFTRSYLVTDGRTGHLIEDGNNSL